MSVIRSYLFCFLAIDNDIMRKMCTLLTSKGTDIDENIANQNHATRTRTSKSGYLELTIEELSWPYFGLTCFFASFKRSSTLPFLSGNKTSSF